VQLGVGEKRRTGLVCKHDPETLDPLVAPMSLLIYYVYRPQSAGEACRAEHRLTQRLVVAHDTLPEPGRQIASLSQGGASYLVTEGYGLSAVGRAMRHG
jgi:hypothetical protein